MKTLRDMPPHKFWRNPDVMGFVQKIAANPEDDLPRLVFADWLQDTAGGHLDNEHAEFIREQLSPHTCPPVAGYLSTPPVLRERVFSGFSVSSLTSGRAELVGGGMVYAAVERGFLSKVWFSQSHAESSINRTLARIVKRKPSGVLTSGVFDRGAGKPIGMFHPYYVCLDDPALLELDTFRGRNSKTAAGSGCVAVDYNGQRFEFPHAVLWKMDADQLGKHVIRETLARYWERRFADFGWPVRVVPTPELVARINKGISRTL